MTFYECINLRYYKIFKGNDSLDNNQFIQEYIENYGVKEWTKFGYGSWPEHFKCWQEAKDSYPNLFIKYEKLKQSPEVCLKAILNFTGIDADEGRINAAVYKCTLHKMKMIESNEKKVHSNNLFCGHSHSKEMFIGEGKSDQTLSGYDINFDSLFNDRFKNYIELLNY